MTTPINPPTVARRMIAHFGRPLEVEPSSSVRADSEGLADDDDGGVKMGENERDNVVVPKLGAAVGVGGPWPIAERAAEADQRPFSEKAEEGRKANGGRASTV